MYSLNASRTALVTSIVSLPWEERGERGLRATELDSLGRHFIVSYTKIIRMRRNVLGFLGGQLPPLPPR